MIPLVTPNPHVLALILVVLTLCGPLLGWAHLLDAGRAREARRYRTMMEQENKRQREASQLAATLHGIAVAHGLVPGQRPPAPGKSTAASTDEDEPAAF